MEAIEFEIKRNKLISEYHKEVHPLWPECQRQREQSTNPVYRYRLTTKFRRKIRPRLEELFAEIARLKQG